MFCHTPTPDAFLTGHDMFRSSPTWFCSSIPFAFVHNLYFPRSLLYCPDIVLGCQGLVLFCATVIRQDVSRQQSRRCFWWLWHRRQWYAPFIVSPTQNESNQPKLSCHPPSGIVAAFLDAGATVVAPVRSERAKTSLLEELGSTPTTLDIVNADVGVEEGAAALAAHLTSAYNGKVNHVVSSCGAWWQGGTLSTVPLDEFNAQLANLITGHFLLYKHLIGLVTDEPSSSFTFITGAAGQYCFLPAASMVTVGAAGAFGVALAAMAEQKSASRRVVEVRISALIRYALCVLLACGGGAVAGGQQSVFSVYMLLLSACAIVLSVSRDCLLLCLPPHTQQCMHIQAPSNTPQS